MTSGHLGHLFMAKCQETSVSARSYHTSLLAFIPMFASISTCVLCALSEDWWAFALILLGIIAGGLSCFVIGSGQVVLKYPSNPADGCPPGDGTFMGEGQDVVVMKGAERLVNVLTKGRFEIELGGGPEYRKIGLAAMLLEVQFLVQLLLIPQATLFGQILFISSLAVSWMYTSYVSSLDKDKIQADILWNLLGEPKIQKYTVGGRSASAVLAALVLQPEEPEVFLKEFVGNETRVWKKWREVVSQWIKNGQSFEFGVELDSKLEEFDDGERALYHTILNQNARNGYAAYQLYEATQEEEYQDEKQSLRMMQLVDSERETV